MEPEVLSFDLDDTLWPVAPLMAAAEQAFFTQGSLPAGTVYQYVTEVDGSTSTYQYSGVVFRLVNAGTWRGDASVKQKLEFFATQRQRI